MGHQSSLLWRSFWNMESHERPINGIDFRSQAEQMRKFGLSLSHALLTVQI